MLNKRQYANRQTVLLLVFVRVNGLATDRTQTKIDSIGSALEISVWVTPTQTQSVNLFIRGGRGPKSIIPFLTLVN